MSTADAGVTSSMNSQSTVITGAWVQAAWHSMRSSQNWPSSVGASCPTPRRSASAS